MTQPTAPQEEPSAPVAFGSTVTILFSDIRGFTEYTDAHGDEAAYRMLQHHNTLIQEQIALYGGHVVKSLGDSFMVSFDAARTAVTGAIGMQRALEQYNRAQQGAKIEIGIGINTGEPVRAADDLFGGAVNLASRICAASGPGRILVSETVRHVVGRMEGAEWLDRGFYEIKGFQDPQHLFEMEWSGGGAVRATRMATPRAGTEPAATPREANGALAPVIAPPPPVSPPLRGKSWLPWAGAAAALLVLLAVGGGLVFLGGQSGAARGTAGSEPAKPAEPPLATSAGGGSPAKLLRSDDFSDPAKGLFLDNQRGTGRITFSNGASHQYQWEYGYASKALVGRIKGPYPENPDRAAPGWSAQATDKVQGDFAAEVRARVTKLPNQAFFSIQYVLAADDAFQLGVRLDNGYYQIFSRKERRSLADGRTAAVNRGTGENLLRVEVRGDTMRAFVNGQEVDRAQHEGLARRGGILALQWLMNGPPAEGEVEVRFTDFKVYTLEP